MDFIGPEPILGLSRTFANTKVSNLAVMKTKRLWRSSVGLRQSKMFIDINRQGEFKTLLNLSRCKLRALVGVLTGHAALGKHLFRIRVKNSPICENCLEEEEDSEHYLCECPAFSATRTRIFGFQVVNADAIKKASFSTIVDFISSTRRFAVVRE